jgi:hypothetical protein
MKLYTFSNLAAYLRNYNTPVPCYECKTVRFILKQDMVRLQFRRDITRRLSEKMDDKAATIPFCATTYWGTAKYPVWNIRG